MLPVIRPDLHRGLNGPWLYLHEAYLRTMHCLNGDLSWFPDMPKDVCSFAVIGQLHSWNQCWNKWRRVSLVSKQMSQIFSCGQRMGFDRGSPDRSRSIQLVGVQTSGCGFCGCCSRGSWPGRCSCPWVCCWVLLMILCCYIYLYIYLYLNYLLLWWVSWPYGPPGGVQFYLFHVCWPTCWLFCHVCWPTCWCAVT